MVSKPHSTKRTLHIFDSIQSIFHSNSHNQSDRHHNHKHDKKHKHNHTIDSSMDERKSTKHVSHKHKDQPKSRKESKECGYMKKDNTNIHPTETDLEKHPASYSKMENVTRILINSANPRGKYMIR